MAAEHTPNGNKYQSLFAVWAAGTAQLKISFRRLRQRGKRDLTKLRRRRQRQRQRAIGLVSKKTTLLVHHVFLYISWPSLHDYNVK